MPWPLETWGATCEDGMRGTAARAASEGVTFSGEGFRVGDLPPDAVTMASRVLDRSASKSGQVKHELDRSGQDASEGGLRLQAFGRGNSYKRKGHRPLTKLLQGKHVGIMPRICLV